MTKPDPQARSEARAQVPAQAPAQTPAQARAPRPPRAFGRRAALTALAAAAPLAACDPNPTLGPVSTSSGTTSAPGVPAQGPTPEILAEGLEAPWSLTFFEGAPLISLRDRGEVIELVDGEARPLLTMPGVHSRGEGGLLGLATHEGFLYTYFTAERDNRIERRRLTGPPGARQAGEPQVILQGIPKNENHNGGRLRFGPDGLLYVTTGDAGFGPYAQDLSSLAGKILRLTPDGAAAPGNPWPDSLVFSYGHRNPQGIDVDAAGTVYAAEFGQNTWDELNRVAPGENYGWPAAEGREGADELPLQQWPPAEASPSGLALTRDRIYIANLRGESLRVVPLDRVHTSVTWWVGEYGRLRDVVVAPDDSLWVLTNNTDGRGTPGPTDDRVLRFVP